MNLHARHDRQVSRVVNASIFMVGLGLFLSVLSSLAGIAVLVALAYFLVSLC